MEAPHAVSKKAGGQCPRQSVAAEVYRHSQVTQRACRDLFLGAATSRGLSTAWERSTPQVTDKGPHKCRHRIVGADVVPAGSSQDLHTQHAEWCSYFVFVG